MTSRSGGGYEVTVVPPCHRSDDGARCAGLHHLPRPPRRGPRPIGPLHVTSVFLRGGDEQMTDWTTGTGLI